MARLTVNQGGPNMVEGRRDSITAAAVSAVEVQRRPLTREEAAIIVRAIRESPHITGYSVAEWTRRRDTFVLIDQESGRMAAALLIHHLIGGWSEFAVVFVMPEYRGNGYAGHLIEATLRTVSSSERNFVLFFSDDVMRRIVERIGFSTYNSVQQLARARRGVGLLLGRLYDLQWLSSGYRIREIRRKRREMNLNLNFKVAVMNGRDFRGNARLKAAAR